MATAYLYKIILSRNLASCKIDAGRKKLQLAVQFDRNLTCKEILLILILVTVVEENSALTGFPQSQA
ncbi:MAG: hypothetical protein JRF56_06545 [Deltaproteobacteria bacterium]|jgi:hypothetical protein|nr:hypothetical protein [Deltaproteobacteria bacterium]